MKNVITEFFWYILRQGNLLFYFTVSFVILSASTMYSRRLCVRNNKVHDHLTLLLFRGGRKSGYRRTSCFGLVPFQCLECVSQSGQCKMLNELMMLLLLFVVITDSRHMAMHFSTSVVFYQLGVSLGERSNSKTEKRKKKMK